jgi:hypothetical protein
MPTATVGTTAVTRAPPPGCARTACVPRQYAPRVTYAARSHNPRSAAPTVPVGRTTVARAFRSRCARTAPARPRSARRCRCVVRANGSRPATRASRVTRTPSSAKPQACVMRTQRLAIRRLARSERTAARAAICSRVIPNATGGPRFRRVRRTLCATPPAASAMNAGLRRTSVRRRTCCASARRAGTSWISRIALMAPATPAPGFASPRRPREAAFTPSRQTQRLATQSKRHSSPQRPQ